MDEYAGEEQQRRSASNDERDRDTDAMQFGESESATREVSQDEVRNRAHEIYLGRGASDGDPVADWLEAERQVRGRSGRRSPDERTDPDQRM